MVRHRPVTAHKRTACGEVGTEVMVMRCMSREVYIVEIALFDKLL